MSDETNSAPAVGSLEGRVAALERLVARTSKLTQRRPEPPRDLMFDDTANVMTWRAPVKTNLATHYRIRINKDAGDPDYELSLGQTSLPIPKGTKVWMTCYNEHNGLESVPRALNYTLATPDWLGGLYIGALAIDSVTVTTEPPNDFGLRPYRVTVVYTLPSPMSDFERVGMWTKDNGSATDTPKDQGSADYLPNLEVGGGHAHCFFMLSPPSAHTVYDLWLTRGTRIAMEPLDAATSAHTTFALDPLPVGAAGHEYCPIVTGLSAGTPTTVTDANGVLKYKVVLTWTNPTDSKFAGVEIVEQRPGPQYVFIGAENGTSYTAVLDCPFAVETHYLWVRSVDRLGKKNTLSGDCPKATITIGSESGQLNLGRALGVSLGSSLSTLYGVLGVSPLGITEDLIGTFAVSQAKLLNAPIIDALRLCNLAVGTQHCQDLFVTHALIAYEAVHDSNIANLAVEKLLAGTVAVAIKLTSPWIAIPGSTAIDIRAGNFTIAGAGSTLDLTSGTVVVYGVGGNAVELTPLHLHTASATGSVEVASAGYVFASGDISAGGDFMQGTNRGITGTRTVKDGAGDNKVVTIKGGIITDWAT